MKFVSELPEFCISVYVGLLCVEDAWQRHCPFLHLVTHSISEATLLSYSRVYTDVNRLTSLELPLVTTTTLPLNQQLNTTSSRQQLVGCRFSLHTTHPPRLPSIVFFFVPHFLRLHTRPMLITSHHKS